MASLIFLVTCDFARGEGFVHGVESFIAFAKAFIIDLMYNSIEIFVA